MKQGLLRVCLNLWWIFQKITKMLRLLRLFMLFKAFKKLTRLIENESWPHFLFQLEVPLFSSFIFKPELLLVGYKWNSSRHCCILEYSANKCSLGFTVTMNSKVEWAPFLPNSWWGSLIEKIALELCERSSWGLKRRPEQSRDYRNHQHMFVFGINVLG